MRVVCHQMTRARFLRQQRRVVSTPQLAPYVDHYESDAITDRRAQIRNALGSTSNCSMSSASCESLDVYGLELDDCSDSDTDSCASSASSPPTLQALVRASQTV